MFETKIKNFSVLTTVRVVWDTETGVEYEEILFVDRLSRQAWRSDGSKLDKPDDLNLLLVMLGEGGLISPEPEQALKARAIARQIFSKGINVKK